MSSRANLLKNVGLRTYGSELTNPEGSLKQATNVNVDENGVITPRRGFADYGNTTDDNLTLRVKQLIEYKEKLFRHFDTKIQFESLTGTFNDITGDFVEPRAGYRIKWQESKGNMYFTTEEGIKRISLKDSSTMVDGGTVTIEQAGTPKAAYMEGVSENATGGFLPAQSKVGYRFIFGRKDANGNLLLGSPSARHIVTNNNERVVVAQTSDLTFTFANLTDTSYIIVPTLNGKYTFYFNKNGSPVKPIKAATVGSVFIEVDIQGAADDSHVAAIFANEVTINMTQFTPTIAANVVTMESTEEGPIDSITDITGAAEEGTPTAGSVTEGEAANCTLELTIPAGITTDYFVQVYRTSILTASGGLTLNDLDPGDETNLVYEAAYASGTEMTFTDTTPESFRAVGLPLYTNEITGDGILQSNDPPPIALDIQLFRGSMFYANTKSAHRAEFDMISVDDYTDDDTRIIISNSTVSRYYTAAAAEDTANNKFLNSALPSVGQAIDETARSLVKVINQDVNSIVNAFYLTGADDLPGKILLEARDLSDDAFYVSVEDSVKADMGEEFSPPLPQATAITRVYGGDTVTNIELTGHGYATNDEVVISFLSDGDLDAPPSFSGLFAVTRTGVDSFSIVHPMATTFDSAGANPWLLGDATAYAKDLASDNLEVPNRVYYSKKDEPEAVPIINYIDVGAKDEEIVRILALRDNLFVLKGDGIYVISGTSAPNFSVRLIDNTRVIAPDSAVVLNNQIFALTEQGVAVITDSGAGIISRGIENLIDDVTNVSYDFAANTFGVAYENDRAYVLFMPQVNTDTSSTQAYRYNIFEKTWSHWEYEATCGHVSSADNKLYLGNGDNNFVAQERKDFERTDFSDRDFAANISSEGVNAEKIKVSSTSGIEVSDVILQLQEVTINYFNKRLLRKMDIFDSTVNGPGSTTMVDSFSVVEGDDMVVSFQALQDHLVATDPSNFTSTVVSITSLRADVELFVDELNGQDAITTLKDYVKPKDYSHEAYVVAIDAPNNILTLHTARPFLQQAISVFKGIHTIIEWNPQHFGDPSAVKQVREVTILFDQNNFNDAVARFGSDVSQALVDVPFKGKGIGYWGDMPWGSSNHYWGGEGNDIPFRTIVPRGQQKCRYLTVMFEHKNARESFRILGVTGVVRAISARGYK